MPDGLYEHDALAWAEQQAGLLERLSRGERVNDAIDWANLIDEVQDVGRSQIRACESLLFQAMLHLMKSAAWPSSRSVPNWSVELAVFLGDAGRAFTPSMRHRIALDDLYGKALRGISKGADESGAPSPLVQTCPWTMDEMLAGDIDLLVAKLRPAEGPRDA